MTCSILPQDLFWLFAAIIKSRQHCGKGENVGKCLMNTEKLGINLSEKGLLSDNFSKMKTTKELTLTLGQKRLCWETRAAERLSELRTIQKACMSREE